MNRDSYWMMETGQSIAIKDMTSDHLENVINKLGSGLASVEWKRVMEDELEYRNGLLAAARTPPVKPEQIERGPVNQYAQTFHLGDYVRYTATVTRAAKHVWRRNKNVFVRHGYVSRLRVKLPQGPQFRITGDTGGMSGVPNVWAIAVSLDSKPEYALTCDLELINRTGVDSGVVP